MIYTYWRSAGDHPRIERQIGPDQPHGQQASPVRVFIVLKNIL